jgi:hypothetical protein
MFCVILSSECRAQQHVLDSLKTEITKNQKQDTSRINAILSYVIAALNDNTSDFLPYMNEVISRLADQPIFRKGFKRDF